MSEPTLFISHKHNDKDIPIAKVLGEFVRARSMEKVKVHLSSDPTFEGPKFGKNLNAQLRDALWKTEVLILLYTTADQDWQYCMWECGMAEYPKSAETNIIIFQCGSDIPKLFDDVVRVDARKLEDIEKFLDQFFRSADFFPSLSEALAPKYLDRYVIEAAKDLYDALQGVLYDPAPTEDWSTWGFLKLQIPKGEVDKLEKAGEAESVELAHQIVKDYAVIVESNAQTLDIFGRVKFPDNMKFETLLNGWQQKYPNEDAAWFGSCCEQIMAGAKRNFPVIRWTPIKKVNSNNEEFIPVLNRIRQVPSAETVHFYIYLYNLSDPRAITIADKMIKTENFFYKKVGAVEPQQINLRSLVTEMNTRGLNRLPIFNDEGHPMFIVHRSMIDRFFANQFMSSENINPADLTLNDLLSDEEMKDVFQNTFVVIKRQASLAEARDAMLAKSGCSDVFITKTGARNESVQGWLTNVDITRNSS